ncbi:hypothetical protein GCK72_005927 [Caenorhabditis remanei]|uniref:Uncharacterized protein n=1 Tax=Caenorhabditis remanei TaxID=31234 RepID=A0A6A5HHX3_CAERE|nr:hypothetical protein GCK72_005927 [Caenorhabditis remanei]KAF1765973.1 hypothetical protein GCK72_005927 [Caenorhabditis remanei]
MPQSVTSAVPKRSYRKEAIVAVAAVGIVVIVWNLRSGFWKFLGLSCSSVSEKSDASNSAPEIWDSSTPKSVNGTSEPIATSSEKLEKPATVEQKSLEQIGNSAPESTEKPTASVYVGLPKADPATVSTSIQPPNWPGATPR